MIKSKEPQQIITTKQIRRKAIINISELEVKRFVTLKDLVAFPVIFVMSQVVLVINFIRSTYSTNHKGRVLLIRSMMITLMMLRKRNLV